MVKFNKLYHSSWKPIFNKIDKNIYKQVEEEFNKLDKTDLYPKINNIFNFTKILPSDIKVIILGQDPYHNNINGIIQATGLAFSVPKEIPIPPSLVNIYKNLQKYKHITKQPSHGCLDSWLNQGVLLFNTSLTVYKNQPNCHSKLWSSFTSEIIKILSQDYNNLIFVLWGANAFKAIDYIQNKNNHKIVISSHPSPLSCSKKFKEYSSFNDTDHFGLINRYLLDYNKTQIVWQID